MALSEKIGRSDCHPIVRLLADTIVRWDYRPTPKYYRRVDSNNDFDQLFILDVFSSNVCTQDVNNYSLYFVTRERTNH